MDITIHIPTLSEAVGFWKAGLLVAVLLLAVVGMGDPVSSTGGGNSISYVDTTNLVGAWTSLKLDSNGNPVISYYDLNTTALNIAHCNDPNCVGDDESIEEIYYGTNIGTHNSLALDADGYPVIAYHDLDLGTVSVVRCNDPNCSGDDESITEPVDGSRQGIYISLALDASGFPVISFLNDAGDDLNILHCNDLNCANKDESITAPDQLGPVGFDTSLTLDANGFPVVSYYEDVPNSDLKVLHCDDANCDGIGDSITKPDTPGIQASMTSIVLDASGNPVIAYHAGGSQDLRIMHCNDPDCSGGDESVESPDTEGSVGIFNKLLLDVAGNPVVSYYDITNEDLRLLHCNDADCADGDDSSVPLDAIGDTGKYNSLALDALGDPVISYYDEGTNDLKLVHCVDPNCTGVKPSPSEIGITNAFQGSLPKTCFDVMDMGQSFLFSVCDNDFQGLPDTNIFCADGVDTICNDEDPTAGSVRVTLHGSAYNVVVGKVPQNITADNATGFCSGATTCSLTFTNTTEARPWNPWDVAGAGGSWPPDGIVDLPNDILSVILHFCPLISDPCAKPTPGP